MDDFPKVRRRHILTATAASLLSPPAVFATSGRRATSASHRSTFVLVHGAWHGGWCWRKVADRLRADGHAVYTPTLTGLGERAHLLTAQTGLSTHVDDIVAAIECEELNDVVLVGHSYAGIVVGGVGDRVRPRLRRLIFLDTLIPIHDQSLVEASGVSIAKLRAASPDGIVAPVPPLAAFGIQSGTPEGDWLIRRLTPHPIAAFEERLEFRHGGIDDIASSYLRCTQLPLPLTAHYAEIARGKGWPVRSIATGHDAMVTAPELLAELLEQEAARV